MEHRREFNLLGNFVRVSCRSESFTALTQAVILSEVDREASNAVEGSAVAVFL